MARFWAQSSAPQVTHCHFAPYSHRQKGGALWVFYKVFYKILASCKVTEAVPHLLRSVGGCGSSPGMGNAQPTDLLIQTNVCYHSWTTQYITGQNRLQFIPDPSQSAGRKNSYHNLSDKETGALRNETTFLHGRESTLPSLALPLFANCWLCPCLGIYFLLVHTITQGAKDILKLSKLDLDSSEHISYPI